MSRAGERERGSEELINKIINNELIINNHKGSFTRTIHKSLAFPETPEIVHLLSDLNVMARRDGWSFCKIVAVALEEYVERHPLPNPQSQIDRMLEVRMPLKPMSQCCVPNCRRKTRWILRLQNKAKKVQEFQVCDSHKRWLHSEFKLLVSYRELR